MSFYLAINNVQTNISVHTAKNIFEYFKGLSDRELPLDNEGMLLRWTKEIQMKTCKIPLDIIFVNSKGVIKDLYQDVLPKSKNRFSLFGIHCFELPTGTIANFNLKKGDVLSLK